MTKQLKGKADKETIDKLVKKYLDYDVEVKSEDLVPTFCFIPTSNQMFCYCGDSAPHYHFEKKRWFKLKKKKVDGEKIHA